MSDVTTKQLTGLALTVLNRASAEEIAACLAEQEEGSRARPRVRYIQLLSEGHEMEEASKLCTGPEGKPVNEGTTARWFADFMGGGLEKLVTDKPRGGGGGGGQGRVSPLTEEVMAALIERLGEAGQVTKEQIAEMLEDLGVDSYKTAGGAFNAVRNKLREDDQDLVSETVYVVGPFVKKERKKRKTTTEDEAPATTEEAPEPVVDADLEADLDFGDDDDWD